MNDPSPKIYRKYNKVYFLQSYLHCSLSSSYIHNMMGDTKEVLTRSEKYKS